MRPSRVAVVGVGAATPAGLTARRSLLSLRAGAVASEMLSLDKTTVRVHPTLPMPPAEDADPVTERLLRLAAPAIADACSGISQPRFALVLACPKALVADATAGARIAELARAAGVALDPSRSVLFGSSDRAEFAVALSKAFDLLAASPAGERVLVGGVDTRVDRATLEALIAEARVRTIYAPDDPKGAGALAPGEGAGFLLLAREGATADEPIAFLSAPLMTSREEDDEGERAIEQLLTQASMTRDAIEVHDDTNGERIRAVLWGRALRELRARVGAPSIEERSLQHELGDADVASFPIALAVAVCEQSSRIATAPASIVAMSSDAGAMGVLVERAEATGSPDAARVLRPSSAGSRARLALRVLARVRERWRAVKHRIPEVRRAPLESATRTLVTDLALLDESTVDAQTLLFVDAARASASTMSRAATSSARSAERRGRPVEPILAELAQLGVEIDAQLERTRGAVLDEVAADDDGGGVAVAASQPSSRRVPLIVSRGAPAAFPFEWRAAPPPEAAEGNEEDEADAPLEEEDEDEASAGAGAGVNDPETSPIADADPVAASECLEAIGRLWRVRLPIVAGRWSPWFEDMDERLLAHLDLLYGIAEPLHRRPPPAILASLPVDVVPLVRGAVTSFDPDRAFADTLVLACARDPRLCRAAVAKARGAHPDLVEAFTDALALGSGPGLDAAVAELCDDDDPAAIGVGLDVMARRRSVRVGAVVLPLYHLDPGVRMRAADTLGFAAAREAATLTLEKRITIEPSLRVQAAIVTSLVRLGAPHASVYAMRSFEELGKLGQDVDPGTRDCRLVFARACAALGRAPEALKLAEIAATAGELEVLGWFGRVTSVDMLIRVLEGPGREDTLLANAASRALVRITGATREVGQREVELGQGHLTTVPEDELELEPTRWRRYWDERGTSLGTGVKYRFGHRFSADLAAAEHVAQGVRVIDRPMVSLEWSAARAGAGHLADERDWAARQIATASLGGPHA